MRAIVMLLKINSSDARTHAARSKSSAASTRQTLRIQTRASGNEDAVTWPTFPLDFPRAQSMCVPAKEGAEHGRSYQRNYAQNLLQGNAGTAGAGNRHSQGR